MSYMKRTIGLDDDTAFDALGRPFPSGRRIEPMSWSRPPLRLWSVLAPEVAALVDAVESAGEEGSGFDLLDIGRVEAFWQMIGIHSVAHGFVLALRNGSRVYLQLVSTAAEKPVEEIEVLPMGDERYPDLKGSDIAWIDEVDALNRFLNT